MTKILLSPHQNELVSAFRAEQKCDAFFKNIASSRRALRQWAGTRYGGVSVRNMTVDVSACETDLCNDRIPGEAKKSVVAPKRESQDGTKLVKVRRAAGGKGASVHTRAGATVFLQPLCWIIQSVYANRVSVARHKFLPLSLSISSFSAPCLGPNVVLVLT